MAKVEKEEPLPSYEEYLSMKDRSVYSVSYHVDEPPVFSSQVPREALTRRELYLERIKSNISSKYVIFHTFIIGAFTIYLLLVYATLVLRNRIYSIGIPGLIACFSSIVCLISIYRYFQQKTFFRFISVYVFNIVTAVNFLINIVVGVIGFIEQLHTQNTNYSTTHMITVLLVMSSLGCFILCVALTIILTIKVFCYSNRRRATEPEL